VPGLDVVVTEFGLARMRRSSAQEREKVLNATPDRGTRRRCSHCGAPFYDLQRVPIICPKCSTKYAPVIPTRRGRATPTGTDPEPVVVETRESEVDEAEEEEDDVEDDEDGTDDDAEPAEDGVHAEKV
jgi:uncharacterized protein (TIGR02300 family)